MKVGCGSREGLKSKLAFFFPPFLSFALYTRWLFLFVYLFACLFVCLFVLLM